MTLTYPITPRPKRIAAAFPGERGAYAELALKKAIPGVKTIPRRDFKHAFEALDSKESKLALVPVENSTEGTVNHVYDLLLKHSVVALAEVFVNIHHSLIINPETDPAHIRRVYSHPQALAQSRGYIDTMGYEAVQHHNTAAAVKMIKEKRILDGAAIASEEAARIYGMRIVATSIEDKKDNITRFLIITPQEYEAEMRELVNGRKDHKTSMVVGLHHESGALHTILGAIAQAGVNMTSINSRPTKEKPWEYVFHIDFEGDAKEPHIRDMLEQLTKMSAFLRVIGSYSTIYQD